MRTKQQIARERLASVLGRKPAVRAAELAAALGISVPRLHRLLDASTLPILVAGKARRTRYALRRTVRGDSGEYPLYAVDASGRPTQVASLSALAPRGAWMTLAATDWPLIEETRDGWWDGLPYPLYDMRPQGYLGRQLARAIQREFSVPDDPNLWNDDEILFALSRVGTDTVGNLILGDPACEHLALECVSALPGIACAHSRILSHAGRTFLEVERFDRHGPWGRSPLISLETVNAACWGRTATTGHAWPMRWSRRTSWRRRMLRASIASGGTAG